MQHAAERPGLKPGTTLRQGSLVGERIMIRRRIVKSKRHSWAVWTRCRWVGMMTLVGTKVSVHEGISGHIEAVTKRS